MISPKKNTKDELNDILAKVAILRLTCLDFANVVFIKTIAQPK